MGTGWWAVPATIVDITTTIWTLMAQDGERPVNLPTADLGDLIDDLAPVDIVEIELAPD